MGQPLDLLDRLCRAGFIYRQERLAAEPTWHAYPGDELPLRAAVRYAMWRKSQELPIPADLAKRVRQAEALDRLRRKS